jgi:hypothetical protein
VSDYFVGLDLGQAGDPTALVVLRRTPLVDSGGAVRRDHRNRRLFDYECPHLERYPLSTPYPEIVARVRSLLARPELQPGPCLALDATGVGRAVTDLFLDAHLPAECLPVTITGGSGEARRATWDARAGPIAYWVPKVELVSVVQATLSSGRLKLAKSLPLAETLRAELLHFKVRITAAAHEVYGTWREGQHDDLVLALALAVWAGDAAEFRLDCTLGEAVPVRDAPRRLPTPARAGGAIGRWDRPLEGEEDDDDPDDDDAAADNYGLGWARRDFYRPKRRDIPRRPPIWSARAADGNVAGPTGRDAGGAGGLVP